MEMGCKRKQRSSASGPQLAVWTPQADVMTILVDSKRFCSAGLSLFHTTTTFNMTTEPSKVRFPASRCSCSR